MVNRHRVEGITGSCLLIKDKSGIIQANDYVSSIRASLHRNAVVEPFVRLGPGCHVAGHVIVGRGTAIGIGPTIIEELAIDSGAVVAARWSSTISRSGHGWRECPPSPNPARTGSEHDHGGTRQLVELLTLAPTEFAALLLVHPPGSEINLDPWRQVAVGHGLAVVADAADCFDCVRPEPALQVISLHPTNALGICEGGFGLSSDAEGGGDRAAA